MRLKGLAVCLVNLRPWSGDTVIGFFLLWHIWEDALICISKTVRRKRRGNARHEKNEHPSARLFLVRTVEQRGNFNS